MSPWRINGKFRIDGLFTLPVLLEGKSFNFLFDPGAAVSTIAPDTAAMLALRAVGSQRMLQGGYLDIICPVYQINSFQISFIRRSNMRMVEMQFHPQLDFDGLLGIDFLRHYRFTLEPDTATLILRPLRK
jgi:predicted aspartyl protease